MKAYNIQWDVNLDDFLEALDHMTTKNAAKSIGVSPGVYQTMPKVQIRDYARPVFSTSKTDIANYIGLPSEVEIPDTIEHDDETISDWLSDTYGFCHTGFELTTVITEYDVYAANMRDAQICTKEDTENDDGWIDYSNDPLLDTVYATDENAAVKQIADSMEIETDALYALQHIVSTNVPVEHDGQTKNRKFEAISFKENDMAGIKITLDNEPIITVYIQDNKLKYFVN